MPRPAGSSAPIPPLWAQERKNVSSFFSFHTFQFFTGYGAWNKSGLDQKRSAGTCRHVLCVRYMFKYPCHGREMRNADADAGDIDGDDDDDFMQCASAGRRRNGAAARPACR